MSIEISPFHGLQLIVRNSSLSLMGEAEEVLFLENHLKLLFDQFQHLAFIGIKNFKQIDSRTIRLTKAHLILGIAFVYQLSFQICHFVSKSSLRGYL